MLATAYGEVVKNLEIAKINLQREQPLYQIIDEPEMPLKVKKASKTRYILIGGFLSFFVIALYLVVRKKVRE